MTELNILYLHGFGSRFDPESNKIKSLSKLGEITPFTYDYTQSPNKIIETIKTVIYRDKIDLIVGTSLGGWYAAECGAQLHIPFVALNPLVFPKSLNKYIGPGIDHYGQEFDLKESVVKEYWDMRGEGIGYILVELDDDIIDPTSIDKITHNFELLRLYGGNHRFTSLEKCIPLIEGWYGKTLCTGVI